jgi:hypothetical protein
VSERETGIEPATSTLGRLHSTLDPVAQRCPKEKLKRMSERMSAAGRDRARSGSWAGIRIQTWAPRGPAARRDLQPLNQTVGGSNPSAGTTLLSQDIPDTCLKTSRTTVGGPRGW